MNHKNKGSMSVKTTVIFIIILFLGFGVYLFAKNRVKAPTENAPQDSKVQKSVDTTSEITDSKTTSTKPTQENTTIAKGTYSSGEETIPSADIQVVGVYYDGKQFSPSSVNIKVGDYVIFYNKSEFAFWPASNDHPTHLKYPEFDAKKAIDAGGKFKFEFTKPGSWGFHDHLNPSATGVVNVVN